MKGVSPLVAVAILLAITIVIGGIVATYVFNTTGTYMSGSTPVQVSYVTVCQGGYYNAYYYYRVAIYASDYTNSPVNVTVSVIPLSGGTAYVTKTITVNPSSTPVEYDFVFSISATTPNSNLVGETVRVVVSYTAPGTTNTITLTRFVNAGMYEY